jgi:hypothetical protein
MSADADVRNGSNSEVAAVASQVCSTPTTDIRRSSEQVRLVPEPEVVNRLRTRSTAADEPWWGPRALW